MPVLAIWSVRTSPTPTSWALTLGAAASALLVAVLLLGRGQPDDLPAGRLRRHPGEPYAVGATFTLFLSFTNLSSTGLSDIIPITAYARSVAMIQQLAGLAYVALFVSRLLSLTLARRR